MSNRTTVPDRRIQALLGKRADVWRTIRRYLADYYHDCEPIYALEGKNRDHVIRYRKGGKTLVTLCPGDNALVVLVVLGKNEVLKAEALAEELNPKTRRLLLETNQLHDGRWLWIEPSSKADVESIKLLLSAKRQPKLRHN